MDLGGWLGVAGGLVSAACAVVSVFQARKSKEEREAAEKVAQSLEVLADVAARQQQAPPWELRWIDGARYLLVNTGAETIDGVEIECLAENVAFGVEAESMPTSIDSHASLSFIYLESHAAKGPRAIRVHWMRSDGTAATWKSPLPPKGSRRGTRRRI
ncbi:hypothetical protein [Schaalia odontolytica]|uniref:hypothetical protein n=1 Tax=Schaalia odontolytica TaxID=1660 RepID=UPI0028D388DD|nr:hypothetical protein [Schaalia odontolytica]